MKAAATTDSGMIPTASDVSVSDLTLSPARFRVFVAMAIAATALSIDSMLPTFTKIRHELGLPSESSATAGLITALFLGFAIGQIPFGVAADRFGRRPVLGVSITVYLVGIAGLALSSTLPFMMTSRFVWGLGGAGINVAALAMVRDRFVGAHMAREMAFVMAVFIIVPIVAPALSAAILHFYVWRAVLVLSVAFGVVLGVLTWLMPETLAVADRQPLRFAQIGIAAKAIARSPIALRYTLLLTAIFGVFSSYLASSERIVGEVFDRKSQFPFLFGGVGIVMGVTSVLVGRNVHQIGLLRLIRSMVVHYGVATFAVLALAMTRGGRPPFWAYWLLLTAMLAVHNIVAPNVNSAAMIPLGHVAGTAAAVVGTSSTAVGAVVGLVIDRAYDGTVRPLAIAFAISAVAAMALALPIRTLDHS